MSVQAIVVTQPFRCNGQLVKPETALEVGQGCDVTPSEARSLVGQKKAVWVPEDELEVEEAEDE
ncbi:hypothetical protein QTO01_18335 [Vibrio mytili]|uniref:hypothetical protein n=1 Tax=Vibrio harveyi group TaxID=717610 RepID=UPI0005F22DD6|nr:hypothetical protein [Vibrio parahaemolyticus]EJG1697260.1 hypothetical protein [Vibrio parahaemolyticus]